MLLSVRPRFAAAIVDGSKTAEVRRQRVDVVPGTPVVLYASAPVMAVVATASIAEVDFAAVDDLWSRHSRDVALTSDEFLGYLDGRARGCVLVLTDVKKLDEEIALAELRNQVAGFQPPQSYRFIAQKDPHLIRSLAECAVTIENGQQELFA